MKKEIIAVMIGIILAITLIIFTFKLETRYYSISGKVIPAEAGIKVQVIQNLSFVAETLTDEAGNYKIIKNVKLRDLSQEQT